MNTYQVYQIPFTAAMCNYINTVGHEAASKSETHPELRAYYATYQSFGVSPDSLGEGGEHLAAYKPAYRFDASKMGLDDVFAAGNGFAPSGVKTTRLSDLVRSVSVGDLICACDEQRWYLVAGAGFVEVTDVVHSSGWEG